MVLKISPGTMMVDNIEEPQVTSESSMDFETVFMDRLLDHMEEFSLKVASLEVENDEFRDKFMNLEEEHQNLKVQYEYTEWNYAQTQKEVKNIGVARSQGFDEIFKF